MALVQEYINYTIPYFGPSALGMQVSVVFTYDNAAPNGDGSFTVVNASGTYKPLDSGGNVIRTDTITGVAPPGSYGNNDNKIFPSRDPLPLLTGQGVTFKLSNNTDGSDGAGNVNLYRNGPNYADGGGNANNSTTYSQGPGCFASGTLIRTPRGDVAVEDLAVGDLVVTSSGEHRPVRWLGHQPTRCAAYDDPRVAWPIRIAAHAFGENRPARDLRVSPAHSIAVDILGEVLIPACALVNGSTVVQEKVDTICYWHVELDSHDVILAENLPAESYLEMNNRGFFAESALVDLAALPDGDRASVTHADFCRPFHADGPVVEGVRAQLRRRAEAQGWRLVTPEPWAGVALEVDGVTVLPDTAGSAARFVFPALATEVWLTCPTGVPAEGGTNMDIRALGLCLTGLTVDDGLTGARAIAMDDPRLGEGLHDTSPGHRWTKDRAHIPSELWEGCRGTVFLRVETAGERVPRWERDEPAILKNERESLAIAA